MREPHQRDQFYELHPGMPFGIAPERCSASFGFRNPTMQSATTCRNPLRAENWTPPSSRPSSLRSFQPALVGMTYEGMEVAEGGEAGLAWQTLVHGQLSPSEKTKLRAALLAYCRQDTEAMVRVYDALEQATGREERTRGARG